MGGRPGPRAASGRREAEMVRAFEDIPRHTDRVIFFPRAAGGARSAGSREEEPRVTVALCATAHRRPRAALGGAHPWIERKLESRRAQPRAPRRRRGAARLRPRPRAPRRAARPRAAEVVRERGGVGDVPRPRLHPGVGRPGRHSPASPASRDLRGAPYAYLVYPHKPIVAYLPQTGPAAERVLRRVPGRDAALRLAAAAGLRRRARQVDGAQGRRAAPDRRGQHAPARPPDRPAGRSSATSGASAAGSASGSQRRHRAPRAASGSGRRPSGRPAAAPAPR